MLSLIQRKTVVKTIVKPVRLHPEKPGNIMGKKTKRDIKIEKAAEKAFDETTQFTEDKIHKFLGEVGSFAIEKATQLCHYIVESFLDENKEGTQEDDKKK